MLKAVPESLVFTVHLGTALHWRGLGRGMGLFGAFAACPGRPEGTRPRHPCPFPNPTRLAVTRMVLTSGGQLEDCRGQSSLSPLGSVGA